MPLGRGSSDPPDGPIYVPITPSRALSHGGSPKHIQVTVTLPSPGFRAADELGVSCFPLGAPGSYRGDWRCFLLSLTYDALYETHTHKHTHTHSVVPKLVITEADNPVSSGDYTTNREDRKPEAEPRCLREGVGQHLPGAGSLLGGWGGVVGGWGREL